jgi:hypothetical protein
MERSSACCNLWRRDYAPQWQYSGGALKWLDPRRMPHSKGVAIGIVAAVLAAILWILSKLVLPIAAVVLGSQNAGTRSTGLAVDWASCSWPRLRASSQVLAGGCGEWGSGRS